MIYPLREFRRTDWFANLYYGSGKKKRAYPHTGIDGASTDRTIIAPEVFTITAVYYHNVSGWTIRAREGAREHKFYHIEEGSIIVKVGQRVKQGQKMATYGDTGSGTSAAHLHWSLLIDGILVDPEESIGGTIEDMKSPTRKEVIWHFEKYANKAPTEQEIVGFMKKDILYLKDKMLNYEDSIINSQSKEITALKAQTDTSEFNILGRALATLLNSLGYKKG